MAVNLPLLRRLHILKERIKVTLGSPKFFFGTTEILPISVEELSDELEQLRMIITDPVDFEFYYEILNRFNRFIVERGTRTQLNPSISFDRGIRYVPDG